MGDLRGEGQMIIKDDKGRRWAVDARQIKMAGIGNIQAQTGEQQVGFCLLILLGEMQIRTGAFDTMETAEVALDKILVEVEKETLEERAHRTAAAYHHAKMEQMREEKPTEEDIFASSLKLLLEVVKTEIEAREKFREEVTGKYEESVKQLQADFKAGKTKQAEKIAELKDLHFENIKEMNKVHRADIAKKSELICENSKMATEYINKAVYRQQHPWRNLFRLKEKT